MAIKRDYKGTLFDDDNSYLVPPKKSEGRNYFFRVPISWIGYISVSTFIFITIFYIVLSIFWISLYQQHFVAVSVLTAVNVLGSLVVLYRNPGTGKSFMDMLRILVRYLRKKQFGLHKPIRDDYASSLQTDVFYVKK